MSRNRTRSARRRAEQRRGVVFLTVGIVVLGALLVAYVTVKPPRLLENGCLASGPVSVTVVIVDSTDELSAVQRVALQNELMSVIGEVPIGGAVQLWRVAASASDVPGPAEDLVCNPGKTVNEWIGNPSLVEKRYRDLFERPLTALAKELSQERSAEQSPIMETIQAASLRTFGVPPYSAAPSKRLILASDLLQNSPSLSQLRAVGSFESFEQSSAYTKVAASLSNVDVQVLYLRREQSPQGKTHLEFWQQYLASSGAALTRVKSIAGIS